MRCEINLNKIELTGYYDMSNRSSFLFEFVSAKNHDLHMTMLYNTQKFTLKYHFLAAITNRANDKNLTLLNPI